MDRDSHHVLAAMVLGDSSNAATCEGDDLVGFISGNGVAESSSKCFVSAAADAD